MDQHDFPSDARIILLAGVSATSIELYDDPSRADAAGTIVGPRFFPSSSCGVSLLALFLGDARASVARSISLLAVDLRGRITAMIPQAPVDLAALRDGGHALSVLPALSLVGFATPWGCSSRTAPHRPGN